MQTDLFILLSHILIEISSSIFCVRTFNVHCYPYWLVISVRAKRG